MASPQDTAGALAALADLHNLQGRYRDAEALHRRALGIEQKVHGGDHVFIVPNLNNLAGVLQEMGRHGEAETLYTRVLAIQEKAYGSLDHPQVAKTFNNLAVLYGEQGRETEATAALQRSVAIEEKRLQTDPRIGLRPSATWRRSTTGKAA